MLQVGNSGLTINESRAHFSLWALLAAPLMAGNDIRNMPCEILEILTNNEVIAVYQDHLGKQGYKVRDDGDLEVWARSLKDGSRAVVLFNRGEVDAEISFSWIEIGYTSHLAENVRDLWEHKELGSFSRKFSSVVPMHGVVMVIVTP